MTFRISLREQDIEKSLKTFALPTTQKKTTNKDYEIKSIVDHLHELFQTIFLKEVERSIDEHVLKFKVRFSMRYYLQMKP